MATPVFATFLLRYQQIVACGADAVLAAGTMTKTSARESSDQDLVSEGLRAGTGTFTEGREQADQDPLQHAALGTQTRTDSRESADEDPSRAGWAVIPRA